MALVGVKRFYAAKYNNTTGAVTEAKVIAKVAKFDLSVDSNDVQYYADNGIDESDKSFSKANLSIDINDLTNENAAWLLGHTLNASDELISKSTDVAPYVSIGTLFTTTRNNVAGFRAIIFHKCQFAEPSDSAETKGETVAFASKSVTGTAMQTDDSTNAVGTWKTEKYFTNETEAETWLKSKLGFSTVCTIPTISVSGTTVTMTAGTGETIYYTTNGTTPSATNGTAYSEAITASAQTMYKAISTKSGSTDSAIAVYEYIPAQ